MPYKKILVPIDGSATANLGLREAMRLAKEQGAILHLLHVVDEHFVIAPGMEAVVYAENIFDSLRQSGKAILSDAESIVRKAELPVRTTLIESFASPAADAIVQEAKRIGPDVIVIGTHGRRGVRRILMGSDAEQVVRSSPVPVLLVRGEDAKTFKAAA